MTLKATALLTSACAAGLCLFSLQAPNDPFFFFVSSSFLVVIVRLALAAVLVNLAFQQKFMYLKAHKAATVFGALLIVFGLAGILIEPLDYALFSLIKPMDYIFFIDAGLLFLVPALTYDRGLKTLPRISRPRLTQPRTFVRQS